MSVELGYTRAATARERVIQCLNAWEAPHLPGLDHTSMRRWATSATWVPPDTQLLVRHRSLDGSRRIVTNSRYSPQGFVIEYDLGLVHSFAQPGTRRLVTSENRYFCTPFEGILDDGFNGLGYVEESPLPMLDVLELRRDPASGEEVLVAGVEDPLYDTAIPVDLLGFIESYPINPRHPPQGEVSDWSVKTLFRLIDVMRWRHIYQVGDSRVSGSIALGGLWTRPGKGLVALHLSGDGRLTSDLLPQVSVSERKLRTKLRWAAAPLSWSEGRPRNWATRAALSRARILIDNSTRDDRASTLRAASLIGYLRRDHSVGWSPLFSATHPALPDQYVTRSELEAADMGYEIDGVLGYVLDRWADRVRDALPAEIKWASRFGQRRRYIEGFRP